MNVGLEIEGIINRNILTFDIGSYHEGIPLLNYWNTQRDSSVDMDGKFREETVVELVSTILFSKLEFKKAINELKVIFKLNTHRLRNVIYFNESTGCHFHISLNKDINFFYRTSHPMIFINTRKYFFKKLVQLKIRQELKTQIINNYNRDYAQTYNEENLRNINDRRREFNFCSELNEKGLEWRSFNLCGVRTWKELRSLLYLAYKTLEYLEIQSKRWKDYERDIIEQKKSKMSYKKYQETIIIKDDIKEENFTILSSETLDTEVMIIGVDNQYSYSNPTRRVNV
jgi:hypothetical protein